MFKEIVTNVKKSPYKIIGIVGAISVYATWEYLCKDGKPFAGFRESFNEVVKDIFKIDGI